MSLVVLGILLFTRDSGPSHLPHFQFDGWSVFLIDGVLRKRKSGAFSTIGDMLNESTPPIIIEVSARSTLAINKRNNCNYLSSRTTSQCAHVLYSPWADADKTKQKHLHLQMKTVQISNQ